MKIYLPWLGEFGSELLKWVTRIKADKDPKIVYFEQGKMSLYPEYDQSYAIKRITEQQRVCAGSLNQEEIWKKIIDYHGPDYEYIKPTVSWWSMNPEHNEAFEPKYGIIQHISCDVAVFPRWRHNTRRKNWEYWPELVDRLVSLGINVFACGHEDSSYKVNCPAAWDYDFSLDASIEAIKNSKIRLGLNTALQILSLYCGKSTWMILRENGMCCNVGLDGVNWNYYHFADHKKVGWEILPWLNQPERIINEITSELNTKS